MAKRLGKVESYKVKQGIFAGLLLVGIAALYLVAANAAFLAQVVFWAGLLVFFLIIVNQYDFLLTLKEYERAVVYRMGRVHRVGGPGWTFVIPLFETFKIVDLRTSTLDVKPQSIITKDNIVVKVDAIIYLFVKKDTQSIINSVIEVDDYKKGAEQFVQATIRDVAGGLLLSELISDVTKLNTEIQKGLQLITRSWGVSVESVEIQSIEIPKEIEEAFSKRAAAEQSKLAQIQKALGMQAEIDSIREAATKLDDKSLSYFYIKALETLGQGASTKFIFPLELTNLIQNLADKSQSAHSKKQLEDVFEQYAPRFFNLLQEAKVPPKRKLAKKKKKRKK